MVRIRGSYAPELMFKDYSGVIWVARKDSPMVIGIADGETYVVSDVPAILKHTRSFYYIGNLEFAKLTSAEVNFYNLDGDEVEKEPVEIKWDAEAVEDTFHSIVKGGKIEIGLSNEALQTITQIYIVACGKDFNY